MINSIPPSFSYVFNHVEFKYASEGTTHGSEHSMDGKFDPFEMQMVFYDVSASATKTYAAAVETGKADAVAILSFPFEVRKRDLKSKFNNYTIFRCLLLTMLILPK